MALYKLTVTLYVEANNVEDATKDVQGIIKDYRDSHKAYISSALDATRPPMDSMGVTLHGDAGEEIRNSSWL